MQVSIPASAISPTDMISSVSRTTAAPFDRLKVYLITYSPELSDVSVRSPTEATRAANRGLRAIASAIKQIYGEGGIRAFWVGNGLSVTKIFPESAIKFFSYETAVYTSLPI